MKFKSKAEREKWLELLKAGKITTRQFNERDVENPSELPLRVLGGVKRAKIIK